MLIGKRKNGKLFIFIGGILATTVVILNLLQIFVISKITKTQIQESTELQYSEFTKAYSLAIKNSIDEYLAHLDFYINADVVNSEDTERITEWLLRHKDKRSEAFDYVAWVDSKGDFFSDNGSKTNVLERDYFKGIMQQGKDIFVDNPVTSKTTGRTVAHICKSAKVGGRTVGFFCGVLSIEKVSDVISGIDIGNLGSVAILSSDGVPIASTIGRDALIEEFNILKQSRPSEYANLESLFGTSSKKGAPVTNSRGKQKYAIAYPIEKTPWTICVFLDDEETLKTASTVSGAMSAGGLLIMVFTLLITGVFLFISIKPLSVVEETIRGIASGDADLTKRITLNTNNEIGRVVEGFNTFAQKLQDIIATMKKSKEQLVDAGQLLKDSTDDTTAAISQIIDNINQMDANISTQTDSVHQTAGAVNEIAANINSLNQMIEAQAASVSEASTAVEQMIGNINSVNASVQKMADAFMELEQKAVTGVQKQNDVSMKISEIEAESQSLLEANTIISGIAEQTNLLAMNAAIEAAHAGEAGKGFSVVADEIRKLSEDSGMQSQEIGNQLTKISMTIEEIVNASKLAQDAFNDVSSGINKTTELVNEITGAMQEQNEGSKQIAVALNTMNDTSREVKTSSFEMAEGNKAILDEIKSLQNATFAIRDGMTEMSASARKIHETGAALADLSNQMEGSINNIGEQVDKFKV